LQFLEESSIIREKVRRFLNGYKLQKTMETAYRQRYEKRRITAKGWN
jgi:hypothetical protein